MEEAALLCPNPDSVRFPGLISQTLLFYNACPYLFPRHTKSGRGFDLHNCCVLYAAAPGQWSLSRRHPVDFLPGWILPAGPGAFPSVSSSVPGILGQSFDAGKLQFFSSMESLAQGKVTFRYKDYRHGAEQKTMTLQAEEFIRRFLLHVLPEGFSASATNCPTLPEKAVIS
jgi:hypothetical protein